MVVILDLECKKGRYGYDAENVSKRSVTNLLRDKSRATGQQVQHYVYTSIVKAFAGANAHHFEQARYCTMEVRTRAPGITCMTYVYGL